MIRKSIAHKNQQQITNGFPPVYPVLTINPNAKTVPAERMQNKFLYYLYGELNKR